MDKIVVAIDSFKGSLTSLEAGQAAKRGIIRANAGMNVCVVQVADGGEGSLDALKGALPLGKAYACTVTAPDGRQISAVYFSDGNTAIVEMAKCSGLDLADKSRHLQMSSFGTGEMIAAAVKNGNKRILLAIGGSGTTDGGVGAVSAMGVQFLDAKGKPVLTPDKLDEICKIEYADDYALFKDVRITVICDVTNPLCGKTGTAHTYAAQKGATSEQIAYLDAALERFSLLLHGISGKDNADIPGMGAAGGICLSMRTFFNTEIRSGIQSVLEMTNFEKTLEGCSLVITGEGKIDGQSAYGKVPVGVAAIAKKHNIPVIAIAAVLGEGYETVYAHGIDAVFNIQNNVISTEDSFKQAAPLIENLSERITRLYAALKR